MQMTDKVTELTKHSRSSVKSKINKLYTKYYVRYFQNLLLVMYCNEGCLLKFKGNSMYYWW